MRLTPLHTGFFKLDGGAMFGVVPRRMWAKMNPPDDQNLCTWAMRALLVQTDDGRNIVVDTGIGSKQDEKFRSHFLPHGEQSLLGALAEAGLSPDDVSDVFLTHLHFDHCGGALWRDERSGAAVPTFPQATYWTNRRHYEWALHPNDREKASFLKENFVPLHEQGRLRFVDVRQRVRFAPGFQVLFLYGHTEAMMAPLLHTPQGQLLYCADLMPAQWHVPMPYVMAYDIRPLLTLREKAKVLEAAVQHDITLFFEHDPVAECGKVARDAGGRIVLARSGTLAEVMGTGK